jgi:beta-lactamase regulating signal transducer with metallopeptidase domain
MISQPILLYVLKSIFVSGVFLGYYWIALRNKNFNYYNRFYLLLSIAGSLIIPFFNFSWLTIDKQDMPVSPETISYISLKIAHTHSSAISWQDLVFYAVIGVSALLLIVFAFNIFKVYQLKRRSAIVKMEGIDFIYTDLDQAPFSFLNNLFWKESISMDDDLGKKIFKHELTHIHQKHTLDVLFCQLINSVLWMNPFNWLIQKELKAIHEFIADKEAVGNNNVEEFVQLLLQTHYGKHFLNPTHAFYYSSIKRRLVMLTTKNARFHFLRKVLVLPLAFAAIFTLSVSATETRTTPTVSVTETSTAAAVTPEVIVQQPQKPVVKNDTVPAKHKTTQAATKPEIVTVTADTIYINTAKKGENGKKKMPDNVLYILNGRQTSAEEVSLVPPGNIKYINVLKGKAATDKYGQAGANGAVEIFLKELMLK